MSLSAPIDVAMHDAFLRSVAIELARYEPEAIGPGLVSRVGRQLQKRFMGTPALGPLVKSRAWF
jgi:hypothetical protein